MTEFRESEIQYSKWERLVQGSKTRECAIAAALLSGFIPESSPGTHKVQASTELNQIRSAKRSFLGSAFRARKRDSAATFPITLLYGVRRVIRPLVLRVYTCSRNILTYGPKEKGETQGQRRGLNPCTLESGSRYTWATLVCVLSRYITRTCYPEVARRNEALGMIHI